jgi:hypothetical protein
MKTEILSDKSLEKTILDQIEKGGVCYTRSIQDEEGNGLTNNSYKIEVCNLNNENSIRFFMTFGMEVPDYKKGFSWVHKLFGLGKLDKSIDNGLINYQVIQNYHPETKKEEWAYTKTYFPISSSMGTLLIDSASCFVELPSEPWLDNAIKLIESEKKFLLDLYKRKEEAK